MYFVSECGFNVLGSDHYVSSKRPMIMLMECMNGEEGELLNFCKKQSFINRKKLWKYANDSKENLAWGMEFF